MKHFIYLTLCCAAAWSVRAQTSAFSYQGRLADGGAAATGIYDLQFAIFAAPSNGEPVGGLLTNAAVAVSNGLFVTTLDFGAAPFSGAARWLEIGVRTNGSAGAFTTLTPRQPITATPYAIRAANFSGAVSDAQLSANVARLNAASQVFSGAVNFNHTSNNFAGSFSGSGAGLNRIGLGALLTTNRAVIGWPADQATTIVSPEAFDVVSVKAGLSHSLALRLDGRVVGWGNNLSGQISMPAGATNVVAISAGGNHSLALKSDGTVLAWGQNSFGQTNVPPAATNAVAVAGGNTFSLALKANGSVLAWGFGGAGQTNIPPTATGVVFITAGSSHALAVKADGTVVGWGSDSAGQTNPPASATNVIAVAAGQSHSLALRANGTVVGWGDDTFGQITIPANATNVVAIAASPNSGVASMALRADGMVLMWGGNSVNLTNVPPAASNVVAIALGGLHALAVRAVSGPPPLAFLDRPNLFTSGLFGTEHAADFQAGGMRVLRLEPDNGSSLAGNIIGGYVSNAISPTATGGNTIAGGGYSGGPNTILNDSRGNFIGAGSGNKIGANVDDAVIGGGFGNTVLSSRSFIGGGHSNTVDAGVLSAVIPGGRNNLAGGNYSLAAGYRAKALHFGTFVWADSQEADFTSTANNQFLIRAAGGVGIGTTNPAASLQVNGDVRLGSSGQFLAPGGVENLRFLRGVVSGAGAILAGQGYTVTRTGVGAYTVTFTSGFADFPTVTVSAQAGVSRVATTTNVSFGSAQVRTFDAAGAAVDAQFHFIATGSR